MESNIIPRGNGKLKSGKCSGVIHRNEFKNGELSSNYSAIYESSKPRHLSGFSTTDKSSTSQPLTTHLKSTEEKKLLMEVQGSHRTLFYLQPSRKHVSSYSTVVVDLEGSSKKVSFERRHDSERKPKKEKPSVVITLPLNAEKLATKGTQTDFRESETQTDPWKHEIRAGGRLLSELLSLEPFTLEKNFPLGKEEIMLIENARQKLAWEEILKRLRGKENETKRKLLVLRMSANETIFKERRKEEEDKERLKMSRQQLQETRKTLEEKLFWRLQRSYQCRKRENHAKINHWNHELARKIRKVKSARGHEAKRDIVTLHKDKTSGLYAPKLRDGENPSLRHEDIDIQCRFLKRFHGLEILEKHMSGIWRPKFSCSSSNVPLGSKSRKLELSLRKFLENGIEEQNEKKNKGLLLKVAVPASTPESTTKSPHSGSEENELSTPVFLPLV